MKNIVDKSKNIFKIVYLIYILFILSILTSCSSLNKSILKLTEKGNYSQALDLLEKAGVGKIISVKAKKEDIEVRKNYENFIEKKYSDKIVSSLKSGKGNLALQLAREGLNYCPWSEILKNDVNKYQKLQENIQIKIDEWNILLNNGLTAENCRNFLKECNEILPFIYDSPRVLEIINQSRNYIFEEFKKNLNNIIYDDLEKSTLNIKSDFILLGMTSDEIKNSISKINLLKQLPKNDKYLTNDLQIKIINIIRYLYKKNQDTRLPDSRDCIMPDKIRISITNRHSDESSVGEKNTTIYYKKIMSEIYRNTDIWLNSIFLKLLIKENISIGMINLAEEIYLNDSQKSSSEDFKNSLAKAHLNRASLLKANKKASIISLLHLSRYRQLTDENIYNIKEIENYANASFLYSENREIPISIDISSNVEPEIYNFLYLLLFTNIESKTMSYIKWKWVDSVYDNPIVILNIKSADIWSPSIDDLKINSSSYFSHYEDVVNPQKKILKTQLSLAKSDLEYAESSYEQAVSWFEISPTEYSLNQVNYAKKKYINALNTYNEYVDLYNASPTIIQRPVYIPYIYYEGTLKQGIRIEAQAVIKNLKENLFVENKESDYVKLGTKHTDRNMYNRHDDGLDFNASIDYRVSQYFEAGQEIINQFGKILTKLEYEEYSNLQNEDINIIKWLLHPFGPSDNYAHDLNIPLWALNCYKNIEWPERELQPPKIYFYPPSKKKYENLTPEVANDIYSELICEIFTKSNVGEYRGTGSLISNDGLILTCAHVLKGSNIKIKFSKGNLAGEYPAQIIFINEKMDVALIKAITLYSNIWCPIRLNKDIKKGENIVALGNPSIPINGGIDAINSISQGIISNTSIDVGKTKRIISDITVSSGSSGGPLISLKTGEIIGVVTAVAKPGLNITGGVSSSGYYCLAAPAIMFKDWLGLNKK